MTECTIWHNPRCSKSRATLQLLKDNGYTPDVRRYLDDPPSAEELAGVLDKLGLEPDAIVRKGESLYKDQFKGKSLSREQWLDVLPAHPALIERPIVITANGAAIGRPPENVLRLF